MSCSLTERNQDLFPFFGPFSTTRPFLLFPSPQTSLPASVAEFVFRVNLPYSLLNGRSTAPFEKGKDVFVQAFALIRVLRAFILPVTLGVFFVIYNCPTARDTTTERMRWDREKIYYTARFGAAPMMNRGQLTPSIPACAVDSFPLSNRSIHKKIILRRGVYGDLQTHFKGMTFHCHTRKVR